MSSGPAGAPCTSQGVGRRSGRTDVGSENLLVVDRLADRPVVLLQSAPPTRLTSPWSVTMMSVL